MSFDLLHERIAHGVRRLFGGGGGPAVESREFWALRDVSFDVGQGEVLGVIGRNGAGKSTLLKVLSRITEPSEGEVRLRGRVASLLEVGTGFHKELTGRENVFLNGAILGMSRAEIRGKFDEIVEFAGVGKFIDTPVKRYSSGMTVRLAFAVAAHLEPEILLVDEVLAVGDAEFQRKCLGKMDEVAKGGRTILFVSHNMAAVEALCGRSVLLEDGRVVEDGETGRIVGRYISGLESASTARVDLRGVRRPKGAESIMTGAVLRDGEGRETCTFRTYDDVRISVGFERAGRPFPPVLGVVVKDQKGVALFSLDNRIYPGYEFAPTEGGTVTCRLTRVPLLPGVYGVDLYLGDRGASLDRLMDCMRFEIAPSDVFGNGRLPAPQNGSMLGTAEWEHGAAP